jgi:hypothetical protein
MEQTKWIDAQKEKPETDLVDGWNKKNGISVKVLVWLEGLDFPTFARYHTANKKWAVEGIIGFDQSIVKWFAYITNPYKS